MLQAKKALDFSLLFLPHNSQERVLKLDWTISRIFIINSRDMVSLEITSIGSVFLYETNTSSHQKASKNQSETKRNGGHCHPVQAKGIFSVPCHLVQFTRATPKLEQKPQHIIKCFFGVVLSVCIFMKISRDGRGALGTSNSKFKNPGSWLFTLIHSTNVYLVHPVYQTPW